jgi:hypothetical protein
MDPSTIRTVIGYNEWAAARSSPRRRKSKSLSCGAPALALGMDASGVSCITSR